MNVLGVAALGSHKVLEVFLSDLPDMVSLDTLFWRNQPKALVWFDPGGFFIR